MPRNGRARSELRRFGIFQWVVVRRGGRGPIFFRQPPGSTRLRSTHDSRGTGGLLLDRVGYDVDATRQFKRKVHQRPGTVRRLGDDGFEQYLSLVALDRSR